VSGYSNFQINLQKPPEDREAISQASQEQILPKLIVIINQVNP
jgi:hypothetical protein